MDTRYFDALARSLGERNSRRGLLGVLVTLPVIGGLFALLDGDETAAKGRRKRRKKRHKHGKGHDKGKHKKKCKPQAKTKTCTGRCGPIKNNCKKTVDCGSCDCPEPCGECFLCQDQGPNTPAQCVADPDSVGDACGETGQLCQADGACACEAGSCPDEASICESGLCTGCGTNGDCEAASLGDLCCNGSCFSGICCQDNDCTSAEAPDCAGRQCTCGGGAACAGDPELCCDGGCVDTDRDEDNCGSCGTTCGSGMLCCSGSCESGVCCEDASCTSEEAPDCVDHACVCAANSNEPCADGLTCCAAGCVDLQTNHDHCGACGDPCGADEFCVDGACQSCTVTCTDPGHICANTALQTALAEGGTVYVCPGRYTGILDLQTDVTIIGAGQGEEAAVDTILDAQQSGKVVSIPADRTVALQRLHLTGGHTTDANGGAAISHLGTLLTMTDCTVADNHTEANSSGDAFGTISSFGRLEMTGCTVRDNSLSNVAGSSGGGGVSSFNELEMTDCVIRNNSVESPAISVGGGLFQGPGTAQLTRCRITENILTAGNGGGGGIFGVFSDVTLTDSFVWNNTAPDCGGDVSGTGCGEAPS